MATSKKPVAKPAAKAKYPDNLSESGKQPRFKSKELDEVKAAAAKKPATKALVAKAVAKKPAAKPVAKKPAAKAEPVKKPVKVAPAPVAAKPPVKRKPSKPATAPKAEEAVPKEQVAGNAPWDSANSDALEAKLPTAESIFPLVPLVRPGIGEEIFSRTFDHKLNINGEEVVVKTGFLSVNRSLDLIGLSQSDDFLNRGFVSQTDEIHNKIRLASLHIQIAGKDKFINCTSIPHEAQQENDFRTMAIREMTVVVNNEGKNYAIKVNANINLEFGTCYLSAQSHPDVEVKGYFLDASRVNYNRRPA